MQIIDTFDEFLECFNGQLDKSPEELIVQWEQYMRHYPELATKCQNDYIENNYDWREVAKTMVFNRTKIDFDKMQLAHDNIKKVLDEMMLAVKEIFNLELDLTIILYCGLGNGAGWVDTYQGKRAILYGIEKMAELNIYEESSLRTLIAHELCHVIHFELRGTDCLEGESTVYQQAIWQLYIEGFAQYYQSKLLHQSDDYRGGEWLGKCELIHDDLKVVFLEGLTHEEIGVQKFFGDWFEVMGVQDAGYFLGAKMIEELTKRQSVQEIATLELSKLELIIREYLKN